MIIIGRHPSCDVVVSRPPPYFVSRLHTQVRFHPGAIEITDLSVNGTYVSTSTTTWTLIAPWSPQQFGLSFDEPIVINLGGLGAIVQRGEFSPIELSIVRSRCRSD